MSSSMKDCLLSLYRNNIIPEVLPTISLLTFLKKGEIAEFCAPPSNFWDGAADLL
jgi:hypothetical protein